MTRHNTIVNRPNPVSSAPGTQATLQMEILDKIQSATLNSHSTSIIKPRFLFENVWPCWCVSAFPLNSDTFVLRVFLLRRIACCIFIYAFSKTLRRTTFSKMHIDRRVVHQTETLSTTVLVLDKQLLEEEEGKKKEGGNKTECQGCYDLKRWILSVSLRTFLLP